VSTIRACTGLPPPRRYSCEAKANCPAQRAGASTDAFNEGYSFMHYSPHVAELNGDHRVWGNPMKRTILIEGLTLFVISIFGLFGGSTLYINRDARTQSSLMAPGISILVLSSALILTALVYVYLSFRKASRTANADLRKPQAPWVSTIVAIMVSVFAVYAYLIQLIGYMVPTILFLLVEFRLLGVKSWKTNIVLTAVVAAMFYIVFIKYCEMIFPHGTLLD
jgi:hypothetical protein